MLCMLQENESLHKKLAAAETARQATMHEVKDVADQCEAAKHAALKLEQSEQALRARVKELENVTDSKGVLQSFHAMRLLRDLGAMHIIVHSIQVLCACCIHSSQ